MMKSAGFGAGLPATVGLAGLCGNPTVVIPAEVADPPKEGGNPRKTTKKFAAFYETNKTKN